MKRFGVFFFDCVNDDLILIDAWEFTCARPTKPVSASVTENNSFLNSIHPTGPCVSKEEFF